MSNIKKIKELTYTLSKVEENYKKENNILELILDSSNIGYWDLNLKTDYEYINHNFKKQLGYCVTDEFPKSWKSLAHPEDLKMYEKQIEDLINGAEGEAVMIRFEHKDGDEITMLRKGSVVERDEKGKPTRIVGVHVDVTESARKERELNASSESLHIVDGNADILWANKKELDGLGYSEGEYIGKSIIDFHMDKEVIADMLGILLGGGVLDNYPARVKGKDGIEKQVLINSSGYFNEDGSFSHTRCFSRLMNGVIDISDMIAANKERIKKLKSK